MRVKTYIVETMPDAMLKIRKDLGGDAVILSTKKIKVGGFLGMFGKPKLEVIAGVDEAEQAKRKPDGSYRPIRKEAVQSSLRTSSVPSRPASNELIAENHNVGSSFSNTENGSQSDVSPVQATGRMGAQAYRRTTELLSGSQTETADAEPKNISKSVTSTTEEEKPIFHSDEIINRSDAEDSLSFATTIRNMNSLMRETSTNSSDTEFRNKLLSDIEQMKAMMNKLAKEQSGERLLPETLEKIWHRLKMQEVDSALAESWIHPAYEAWETSGETLSDTEMKRLVKEEISRFLNSRISGGISNTAKVVYVAGPTGVGKTTTIAKMAADQIFRNHKKVGFITADTYRISAVEQLRTYAAILNVPLEVVQSPGDMKRAASRLEDCDLIFMDTAGRNYLNELYVAELHSLLTLRDQSETCLVLSLTSKPGDMKAIAEHFSKYGLDKVIFTKLDETESCGGLFNLISDYPLQLLYLTNGQNVPDDLIQADRELLLNLLLGDEFA